MNYDKIKNAIRVCAFLCINGIFLYILVWSILFKVNIGFPGREENYLQYVDMLRNLKWGSLAGLFASWIYGYLTIDSADSRFVRWSVICISVLALTTLIVFILTPSY